MKAIFITSTTGLDDLPIYNKPQVAIVGRSNVGKSSLINHLTQQKNLARVSSEAGRTKTINLYEIDKRWFLVDLPGYGYAKTSKEQRAHLADMIHNYLSTTEQLKMVFVIIDAFVGATPLDEEMFDTLQNIGLPYTIIANKIDKLSKSNANLFLQKIANEYPDIKIIAHSILSAKHRGEILETMEVAIRSNGTTKLI